MQKFWLVYIKFKYGEKAKLNYIDTYNFIARTIAEDIYAKITKSVEAILILQIKNLIAHYLEKIKKKIESLKDR